MKYFVEVAGRECTVSIDPRPDGTLAVSLDGAPVSVELQALATRELSLLVGDKVADLTVEGAPPTLGIIAAGRRTYVKVESERARMAARAAGGGASGREGTVRSPMPGRVVKVLVAEGERVGPGQAVAIVEAMKMENEVRAKVGGVVATVHARDGATVEANAKLVSFAAE